MRKIKLCDLKRSYMYICFSIDYSGMKFPEGQSRRISGHSGTHFLFGFVITIYHPDCLSITHFPDRVHVVIYRFPIVEMNQEQFYLATSQKENHA